MTQTMLASFTQVLAPVALHSPSPAISKDLAKHYWPNRAVLQIMTPQLPVTTALSTPQNLPSTGFTLRLVGNETAKRQRKKKT